MHKRKEYGKAGSTVKEFEMCSPLYIFAHMQREENGYHRHFSETCLRCMCFVFVFYVIQVTILVYHVILQVHNSVFCIL